MSNDRFPTAMRGYRRDQVDAFMARLEGTLGLGPLTAPPITADELAKVGFASGLKGYDRDAVDLTLREAAEVLRGNPGLVGPYGHVSAPASITPPPDFTSPPAPGMPPQGPGMPPQGPAMAPPGPGMPPGAGMPPPGPGMPPPGPGMPPPGPGMPPPGPGMGPGGAPPGRPAGHETWLERVRDIRFPVNRFSGYAIEDVDAFLDRVQAALSGAAPPLTPEEIRGAQFATSKMRRGYDEQEVDGFLDELERYVAGGDPYMG